MALEHIVHRIRRDPEFADRFKADPRKALEDTDSIIEESELNALLRALESYREEGILKADGTINWLAAQFETSTT